MRYLRPIYSSLLLLICILNASGQNLVINGNFESYSTCPTDEDQMSRCTGWKAYHSGSSDYFNVCSSVKVGVPVNLFGNRWPESGKAYAGIHLGSKDDTTKKEYIAGILTPLQKDIPYEVSMSLSLADISKYATNHLGVWFNMGGSPIVNSGILPVTPQVMYNDTILGGGWTRVKKIFVPDADYRNIVIGSFIRSAIMDTIPTGSGSANWTYYYIDSVVIKRVSRIAMGEVSSNLCQADSLIVPFIIYGRGYFLNGNTFSLQLSDPVGSFVNFTTIATIADTTSNIFKLAVPTGITPGYNYRLRIVSNKGADTSAPSQPISIGNLKPTKPEAGSNAPVCTGNTLHLNAHSTTPGVKYLWSGPRGFTDTAQNTFVQLPTILDSGVYIVSARLYGCLSYDTVDGAVIHVIGTVTASINDPVCQGDTLKLNGKTIGLPVSYTWAGPNGFHANSKDTFIIHPSNNFAGNYIFTTYFKGCAAADTITVAVNPSPNKPDAGVDTTICAGQSFSLNGTSNIPGITYTWRGPNNFSTTSKAISFNNATPVQSGHYVFIADLNGCKNKDSALVNIKPLPETPAGTSNSPLKVGDELRFNITNAASGTGYSWSGPAGFNSSILNPFIVNTTKANAGTYHITASKDGCVSASLVLVTVEGVLDSTGITVYPNANNGNFTILAIVQKEQQVTVNITADNGQLVYTTKETTKNKLLNLNITLQGYLASGYYNLSIMLDGKMHNAKLVILRH